MSRAKPFPKASRLRPYAAAPDLEAWRRAGFYLPFQPNLQVFVSEYGSGPPLLALHAFPTSSIDYAHILPFLTQHARLVLIDFPGYGFSDKPRGFMYSLRAFADVVEYVLAKLNLQQINLLAHDIGASVALELLQRGTINVEKLILMNASILPSPFINWMIGFWRPLLLNPVIGPLTGDLRLLRRWIFAMMLRRLFARPLTRAEVDLFWKLLCYNDGVVIYYSLLRYMPERRWYGAGWIEALQKHSAPLSLIWGQRDPIAVPAIAEAVLQRRPDAHYFPFDDLGHYPHWEAPDRVASVISGQLMA